MRAARQGRALLVGLLLTLAAALAIGANVALLDQGASPGELVGRLGRDLGQTRPAATQPIEPPTQARPGPATTTPGPTQAQTDESDPPQEFEDEPEGWDDDD